MHPEVPCPARNPRRLWPWIVLAGVILFFILSVVWLLVFAQRVKRIRESTYGPTNQALTPGPAPAGSSTNAR